MVDFCAFKFPLRLREPSHGWKMFQLHPGLPPIMEVEDGFGTQDVLPLGSCSTSIMEGRVSHDQEMTMSLIGFCTLFDIRLLRKWSDSRQRNFLAAAEWLSETTLQQQREPSSQMMEKNGSYHAQMCKSAPLALK